MNFPNRLNGLLFPTVLDIANWGKNSEHVNEIAANSCDFPWTNSQINRNHLSNLHTSSLNCLKDESDFPKYTFNRCFALNFAFS